MDRIRTFWEASLKIDKMGGLGLYQDDTNTPFSICHWDNEVEEVVGILKSDSNIIWEGVVYTKNEIGKIFKPYQGNSNIPTPYRLRPGNLGIKRKTRGFLRARGIELSDCKLIATDSGGITIRDISSLGMNTLNCLILSTKGRSKEIIIKPSSQ